ncbi:MAG TPA: DNA-binding response regulator [Firmicutes bacterium]|nr:DNA-binding response regulator [Bacillota bacterium]
MDNKKYKVLIVEDQAMPLQLFEQIINDSARYEVASKTSCATFALPICLSKSIDLILMDVVTANGASGLEASAKIKEKFKSIKIIIVTSMPECSYIKRARQIGVDGFWYKENNSKSILDVMDDVMSNKKVFPDKLQRTKIGSANSDEFTNRELEILREMTGGYSNQEIASKYGISLNTVRNHVANMLNKTGFRNRIELAVRARESGLVILDRNEDDI